MFKHFLIIILFIWTLPLVSEDIGSLTDYERSQILNNLDWKYEGRLQLSKSNSTLSIPNDRGIVLDQDANTFESVGVRNEPSEEIEAVVCNFEDKNRIIFEYFNDGYITLDDWNDIDSDQMIQSISKNCEQENVERRKLGLSEMKILGWMEKPTYDRKTNTIYWIIEADEGYSDHTLNAVALKLGRYGYEKLTWVTSKSHYSPYWNDLKSILYSYSFNEGFRYEDFTSGDKIAEYGIKALVTASAGGAAIKALGLLGFLKKFLYFIFAGIAAVFYKIKTFFSRKKATAN